MTCGHFVLRNLQIKHANKSQDYEAKKKNPQLKDFCSFQAASLAAFPQHTERDSYSLAEEDHEMQMKALQEAVVISGCLTTTPLLSTNVTGLHSRCETV